MLETMSHRLPQDDRQLSDVSRAAVVLHLEQTITNTELQPIMMHEQCARRF